MTIAGPEDLDTGSLKKILSLVHKLTGITMGENKKTMIQVRLRPRLRELSLSDYAEYIQLVEANKDEAQEFINMMTTNETTFFRTQRVWDFFMKDFLPNWTAANPKKTLKIWSGASSSGEEIYTIGVCCEEHRLKNPTFNYQILGTDISKEVLATAEKGHYAGRSIETFRKLYQPLFEKHMVAAEGAFHVKPEIKAQVKFAHHNLFNKPQHRQHFDIVFLRNVLIYFEARDQEIVLENISQGLIPAGLLIIGESESLSSLKVPFEHKFPLVYMKREVAVGKSA